MIESLQTIAYSVAARGRNHADNAQLRAHNIVGHIITESVASCSDTILRLLHAI